MSGSNPNKTKKFPLVPLLAGLGIVTSILYYQYQRYGLSLFVDRAAFDTSYSASEWHGILSNKTLLLVGGPHRGGTTVLWKALDAHPDISGLGKTPPAEDGSDDIVQKRECEEGILIQDVYSRRGIGMEHVAKSNMAFRNRMLGLGKYALGKEAQVHLTEGDARVTPQNMAKLLNRYNHYWNASKSVLVEKSPPNAVMSRFLQAVYNEGRGADDGLQIKFLFMTRHPIANALAHQSAWEVLTEKYGCPFSLLMDNYIQVHRYLHEDLPHLKNDPMLVKLEDFALNPKSELEKIYQWLGVDSSPELVNDVLENRMQEPIREDPNSKYRAKWCEAAGSNGAKTIASKYQPLIEELQLGYDITDGWCK